MGFECMIRLVHCFVCIVDKVYAGEALWSKHGDTIRNGHRNGLCAGSNQGTGDAELAASNVYLQAAVGFLQAYLTRVENYSVIMHKKSRAGRP